MGRVAENLISNKLVGMYISYSFFTHTLVIRLCDTMQDTVDRTPGVVLDKQA